LCVDFLCEKEAVAGVGKEAVLCGKKRLWALEKDGILCVDFLMENGEF